MNKKSTLPFVAALTMALLSGVPAGAEAEPPKGGKAGARMSDKSRINTNAQWSADPEKGWVRAEERHQLQKQMQTKDNHGKRKGKVSKNHSESARERKKRK